MKHPVHRLRLAAGREYDNGNFEDAKRLSREADELERLARPVDPREREQQEIEIENMRYWQKP